MAGLYDDLYSGCEEAYWLDLLYFFHRIFKLDFTTRRTAIVDKAQGAIEFACEASAERRGEGTVRPLRHADHDIADGLVVGI